MKLKISKKQFATIGSNTISGLMVSHPEFDPQNKNLTLVFEETSNEWKKHNDGPDLLIMPEYVPGCLIENVLYLVEQGYKIAIAIEINDHLS